MNTLKPILRASTLAVAIALSAAGFSAYAQAPFVPPGPAAHAAQGAGGIEGAILRARTKLNLTDPQAAQLDAIVASAKSQAQAAQQASQATIAEMKAELAKAQPNLRRLAQLQDSIKPQREAIHHSVRDQLLAFYDTLSTTQQQVVIDGVRKMAAFRERMARRWTGN